MLKNFILFIVILGFLSGCTSKEEEQKMPISGLQTIEPAYRDAIKESILKSISEPNSYREISWKKMQSSQVVAQRIDKKALFVAHSFSSKNIYQGTLTKEYIYFIGDSKPSLLVDFEIKKAFEEFLANKSIRDLFPKSLWDFEKLHADYQQNFNNKSYQENIKDFIYAMKHLSKEEQNFFIDAISNANTPISRARNLSIFLTMQVFPELMEELLFNEITYTGKYK